MNQVRMYRTHNGTDCRLVDICDKRVRYYELSEKVSYITDSENGAMCQSCCQSSFRLDELITQIDGLISRIKIL